MNLKDLPRSAVGGALKVARIPVDAVLDRAPANPVTTKARELFDRADATSRGAAGTALDDEALGDDEPRGESRLGRVAAEDRAEAQSQDAAGRAAEERPLKDAAERAKEERKAEDEKVEGSRGAPPR